jgi:lipooligosaccharide transport system permease protein
MSVAVSARVVEREARVFARLWRGSIFSSFLTPVLYLGAMGVGLGGIVDARNRSVDGLSYLVFVTPGLMAAGAVTSASGESLWPILSGFKWMRHYEAMSAAVPRPSDIYNGVVGWIGCHIALTSSAFLLVAALLGGVQSAWAPLAVPAAVLGALAIVAPWAAVAAPPDKQPAFSPLMRLAVFPLFLFSGTFFPVSLLPDWARWLVVFSPLWHAVELCRAATTGRGSWTDFVHVAVLLACIGAGAWWGHRTFTRRLSP